LKKITCANYKKLFHKTFLLFLFSANFFFAADKFGFFSNTTIATFLWQALACNHVSVLNYPKKYISFLNGTDVSTHNLFFSFIKKICVGNAVEEVKNIDTIIDNQIGTVFGLDRTAVNFI
jgi:hypothetical protein